MLTSIGLRPDRVSSPVIVGQDGDRMAGSPHIAATDGLSGGCGLASRPWGGLWASPTFRSAAWPRRKVSHPQRGPCAGGLDAAKPRQMFSLGFDSARVSRRRVWAVE